MRTIFSSFLFLSSIALVLVVLVNKGEVESAHLPGLRHVHHQSEGDVHEWYRGGAESRPGMQNVTTRWETQLVDHFGWGNKTYQQRWFVYDKYYKEGSPLFFYTGNEVNAEYFVNWNSGMFTRVQEFNAVLVWAEHRFFGESHPCAGGVQECGDFLSMEQALQDYITLISRITATYYPLLSGATVAFGGSYGGILASSIRIKAPQLVAGAIASSAPVGCNNQSYAGSSYWQVVTDNAEKMVPGCSAAVYKSIMTAVDMLNEGGFAAQQVVRSLKLCAVPDVATFGYWTRNFFDEAAMSSYPFATDYIAGDANHFAPAYPMRHICNKVVPEASTASGLLEQLGAAISVIGNLTQNVQCYNTSTFGKSVLGERWAFMVCTAFLMNELPFWGADANSMFYPQRSFTKADYAQYCQAKFGKTPRFDHLRLHGFDANSVPYHSNMVFFAGGLDPWSSGNIGRAAAGYFYNVSETLTTYVCPDCGHHMDLMPPSINDTASVKWIRRRQTEHIRRWIDEYTNKKQTGTRGAKK